MTVVLIKANDNLLRSLTESMHLEPSTPQSEVHNIYAHILVQYIYVTNLIFVLLNLKGFQTEEISSDVSCQVLQHPLSVCQQATHRENQVNKMLLNKNLVRLKICIRVYRSNKQVYCVL